MTGKFITFEGGEGAGKSTQCKLLHQSFLEEGFKTILTREPGGTKGAEEIRELVVKGSTDRWEPTTELLLHTAARSEHISKLIKPSLEQGTHIICDRFIDSTIAYQGFAHGLTPSKVVALHELLFGNFYPDITILIDIDPEQGIGRTTTRDGKEDRYEKMGLDFHKRLRDGFKTLAIAHPERYFIITSGGSIAETHQLIVDKINKKFGFSLKYSNNS
jgi:dTMP kinase